MQRIICHLDMDAFFASVEEKHDPSLKGKPVLVSAGPVGRGAVASGNYIARKLGVKTGMSTREAVRMIPNAIVVRANYDRYQEASHDILRIIYRFTPDIEPLSLDECFFDLSHVQHRWPDPREAAEAIQRAIDKELQLSASIGVSSGKALAKIASDFKKPHGITVVPFDYERDWIDPLPIEVIPGVGRATYRKLSELGIVTCGDICTLSLGLMHKLLGQVHGSFLWNLAHGHDDRALATRGDAKSISHQSTLQNTTSDKDYVESILLYIAERCVWRLQEQRMKMRSVGILVRFADGGYANRIHHFKEGVQSEQLVLPVISELTKEIWLTHPRPRVNFLGVHLSDFRPAPDQEELFVTNTVRCEALSRVLGSIRKKAGSTVIANARTFGLHHSYRLSQAGLSFKKSKLEESEVTG